jgi:hypothetical protein
LLRQDLRSKKKQLIAANLTLTDAEATKFWPVYDQYSADLAKLGDKKYIYIADGARKDRCTTGPIYPPSLSLKNRHADDDDRRIKSDKHSAGHGQPVSEKPAPRVCTR